MVRRCMGVGLLVCLAASAAVAGDGPFFDRPLEASIERLEAEDGEIRETAARALFLHAPTHPEAAGPLTRALEDPENGVRLAALQALLRLPEAPKEALLTAADDTWGPLAFRAVRALEDRGLAEEACLATRIRLLTPRWAPTIGAPLFEGLHAYGAKAAPASPALERLLDSQDDRYRRDAERALVAIGVGDPHRLATLRALDLLETGTVVEAMVAAELLEASRGALDLHRERIQRFLETSAYPEPHARRVVIARLLAHTGGAGDAFWVERLQDADPEVADMAAGIVAPNARDLPSTWDALVAVLFRRGTLDSGAGRAVEAVGAPIASRLVKSLRRTPWPDPDARGRHALALALARLGEHANPALAEHVRGQNPSVWSRLVLLHLDPARTDLLRQLGWDLRNSRPEIRRLFLDPYGRIANPHDPLFPDAEQPEPAPRKRPLRRGDVERVDARLCSKDAKERRRALSDLRDKRDLEEKELRVVSTLLDDHDFEVRRAAADIFDTLDHGRVAETQLLEALLDEDLVVRRKAARSLRLAGGSTEASLPILIKALEDVDWALERQIRWSKARTNWRFFQMIRRYREDAADLRYELLGRLRWHEEGIERLLPLLPPMLGDDRTCHGAIDLLLRCGPEGRDAIALALVTERPEAVEDMARALLHVDTLTDGEAAWLRDAAIRYDRMPESWPCFETIARHDLWKPGVVRTLIQKLEREPDRIGHTLPWFGATGSKDAAAFAAGLLDDDRHRFAALRVLQEIGPQAACAVDVLRARIATAPKDELHAVCEALAAVGPDAKPALPELLELLGGDARARPSSVMRWIVAILPSEEAHAFLESQLLDADPARRRGAYDAIEDRTPFELILDWVRFDRPTFSDAGRGPGRRR